MLLVLASNAQTQQRFWWSQYPENVSWFEMKSNIWGGTWVNIGMATNEGPDNEEPGNLWYSMPTVEGTELNNFDVRGCNPNGCYVCIPQEPPDPTCGEGYSFFGVVVIAQPPPTFPIRINSGGPAYVDTNGNTWQADTLFNGGTTYSVTNPISGTQDGTLYQTERYGNFSYSIPVPNGMYNVNFHFAELFQTAKGTRIFDVVAENNILINDLDIFSQVGRFAALSMQHSVEVQDGALNISFVSVVDNATVVALSVNPLQPTWVEVAPNRYRYAHPWGWLEVELLPNGDVIQRIIQQP